MAGDPAYNQSTAYITFMIANKDAPPYPGGAPVTAEWSDIYKARGRFDGLAVVNEGYIHNTNLASKGFTHDNNAMFWVSFQPVGIETEFGTTLLGGQGGYFLYSSLASAQVETKARVLCERGDGVRDNLIKSSLSEVVSYSSLKYGFACLKRTFSTKQQDFGRFLNYGLQGKTYITTKDYAAVFPTVVGFNFSSTSNSATDGILLSSEKIHGTRFLSSGSNLCRIGRRAEEVGFSRYPHATKVEINVPGGGTYPAAGTYYYAIIYEYEDESGEIHRSAPEWVSKESSALNPITLDGATQITRFFVQCLHEGDRQKLQNTYIYVYRAAAGGVFKKIDRYAKNNPDIGHTIIVDDTVDVSANEVLYVTGGVIENIMPHAPRSITTAADRVFVASQEDNDEIWYSKQKQTGLGLQFSDVFTKKVPEGGKIIALSELDKKIIVFKRNMILYFYGDGPGVTGLGRFSDNFIISEGIGCRGEQSVLKTPMGIFFQSYDGRIYLLRRDMKLDYIGRDVEDETLDTTVFDVSYSSATGRVSFLLAGGSELVYSSDFNAWSKNVYVGMYPSRIDVPNNSIKKLLLYDDIPTGYNLPITIENFAAFKHRNTEEYPLLVKTAPIKLNGIAGYQRVKWVTIIGDYKTAHTLTVKVYYDYETTASETITFAATAAEYSGSPPYEFKFKPAKQKCQAIAFEINDGTRSGTTESLSLSAIELVVGIKPTEFKTSITRTT
jgi:hypothetical protein